MQRRSHSRYHLVFLRNCSACIVCPRRWCRAFTAIMALWLISLNMTRMMRWACRLIYVWNPNPSYLIFFLSFPLSQLFLFLRFSFKIPACVQLTALPAVVIQTPYSPFQDFSVVARINISSGSVISLLFDNTEEDLNNLIKRLRWRCTQTRQSPLSLPAILFEGYGYTSEECRRRLDAEVVSLEVRTGMTSLDTNQGGSGYSLRISDYERMMRDLHSCNTNLIFLANVLNFEMEFGAFCGRIFDVFEELRGRIGEGKFHTERARDEFQRNLAYCVDSSRFRQKQTQSLRMRVKSQINVVSFFCSSSLSFPSSRKFTKDYIPFQDQHEGRAEYPAAFAAAANDTANDADVQSNLPTRHAQQHNHCKGLPRHSRSSPTGQPNDENHCAHDFDFPAGHTCRCKPPLPSLPLPCLSFFPFFFFSERLSLSYPHMQNAFSPVSLLNANDVKSHK